MRFYIEFSELHLGIMHRCILQLLRNIIANILEQIMVVSQFSFTVNGNFKLAINLILEIEMCLAGHLIRCCYFTLAIEINVIKSLKPQWNCDSNPFILKFLICQSAKLTVLTNPVRHFYELSLGSNSWNNCRTAIDNGKSITTSQDLQRKSKEFYGFSQVYSLSKWPKGTHLLHDLSKLGLDSLV